jgi:hypothetical protein
MTYLLLTTATLLSCIAEYYSIMGLIAIFAGAPVSIAVMGGILGVSKLTITSWLYRNWKVTPISIRTYFVSAIAVLMLLTSMGIFGFLSKAHLDQNLVSGDVMSQLALIEERIIIEKENIDANRKIINQLDVQVNETISRTATNSSTTGASGGDSGIARSISIRRSQAKERQAAQEAILSSQGKISKLNEAKAPIAAEARKVEAEVGPVKYIAQLIYGQEATSQDTLEQAVRWVIILIVFVFDPLAVLMFIAVNQDMKNKHTSEKDTIEPIHTSKKPRAPKKKKIEPDPVPIPKPMHSKLKKPKIEWERDRELIKVESNDGVQVQQPVV